ncbi:MAG: DMT family transporter [Xanthomonadales bacterium]|nr:DMT family transporter [Gammaproteobacteria bacterium]MBT8052520.1 DMT family transporter [Gammaproteobacteria bacterium]NND57106.1 DMT family transporter [Xanthomonadales bacterium]NNK52756.1 DMT family transporter [Xanthomonadales bacterium]
MSSFSMPLRDLVFVLVICIVWAGNFIAGASGMQHFSPFLFMILRFTLLLIILLPFIRRPPPGQWLRLISVCLLIGALHFTFMFWALSRSEDVSTVAIVQQTYIPIAVVLAMILMKEAVGWKTLAATLLAFLGVLVIGFDPLVLRQTDVLAITLASALFQALGSIYQRGIKGVGVLSFQAWTAVIALPLLLAATLLAEQGQLETIRSAQWQHWASVAYSTVMASLVGHGLFFFLVQRHPVSSVMPYLQLTPVLAVIFGIIFWGDKPGARLLLGGALVITGILVITLRARQKAVLGSAGQD